VRRMRAMMSFASLGSSAKVGALLRLNDGVRERFLDVGIHGKDRELPLSFWYGLQMERPRACRQYSVRIAGFW